MKILKFEGKIQRKDVSMNDSNMLFSDGYAKAQELSPIINRLFIEKIYS